MHFRRVDIAEHGKNHYKNTCFICLSRLTCDSTARILVCNNSLSLFFFRITLLSNYKVLSEIINPKFAKRYRLPKYFRQNKLAGGTISFRMYTDSIWIDELICVMKVQVVYCLWPHILITRTVTQGCKWSFSMSTHFALSLILLSAESGECSFSWLRIFSCTLLWSATRTRRRCDFWKTDTDYQSV